MSININKSTFVPNISAVLVALLHSEINYFTCVLQYTFNTYKKKTNVSLLIFIL